MAPHLAISCDRNGAVDERSSMPVARSMRANHLATGKPQPGRWPVGWPNAACSAGVSDIEKLELSRTQTRWPSHWEEPAVALRNVAVTRSSRL
jgi:hypothetical protein